MVAERSRWSLLFKPAAVYDFLLAALTIFRAERSRRYEGPGLAVPRFRGLGTRRRRRTGRSLARLRRVIGIADRWMPGGPNCYRRALAEMALDAGSAELPLHMGLVRGQPDLGGHAWLGDQRDSNARYEVELAL